ncbi:Orotate phosphoribosyltransferase [Labeo rohita]|uniref:Orotate phosphoribosyltransferase n=1 Tax=Labeo rohita TaxID=84645 RepID=A0ABQ8L4H4_LABRO|nr:Orotate phosphoribosyltransferase [Labeo rohita]
MLTEEVSGVRQQQKTIMSLVEEVKASRQQNIEKDKWIMLLENRVADLEQYTRMNDIIVTGLEIKPRSYARAVTTLNEGETSEQDDTTVEQQVTAFLHSKGIELDRSNIEACHSLPRRLKMDRPAIIVRFANRKHKTELLKQGRRLKGTDVYLNEHLTKKNADIARQARLLRRQKKIQSTWTTNCKIFIKLNGTPEQAKVLVIRQLEESWININELNESKVMQ